MSSPPLLAASLDGLDDHETWPGHPERKQRLRAATQALEHGAIRHLWEPIQGRLATLNELGRVHDPRHLEALAQFCRSGGGDIDPDTAASSGSWATAVRAAGLGLAAVEALESGAGRAAFVAVRPPGHHATPTQAMGFCLINNVAVAAARLAEAGQRVLIVDWDVHHGNGTQEIFWNDPRVLYVSTHQWPAYPGTGRAFEVGGPDALGLTVNIPLPAGATGDVVLAAFDEVAAPVVAAFEPTWVLVSAGYDGHRDDPIAELRLSAGDFGLLAQKVATWAPRPGRLVAFLEGGYDVGALERSIVATLAALGGAPGGGEGGERPTSGGRGREVLDSIIRLRTERGVA